MHVLVVAPFVAVTVTVSPVVPPAAEIVGVVSFVMLSVPDDPVSDARTRSGVAGAAGAVRSMVTVVPGAAEPGPTVPLVPVIELTPSVGISVPSLQLVTVIVYVVVEPVVGDVPNVQPVAVPVFVISDAVRVVASTAVTNVSV